MKNLNLLILETDKGVRRPYYDCDSEDLMIFIQTKRYRASPE